MIYQICPVAAYFSCGQTWALLGPDVNQARLGSALLVSILTFAAMVMFALLATRGGHGSVAAAERTKLFGGDDSARWPIFHAGVLMVAYGLLIFLMHALEVPAWSALSSTLSLGGSPLILLSAFVVFFGALVSVALARLGTRN